ncbi:MAG: hypothetical protein CL607_29040 [Anaerolineaceae bacterium]|nr:hypothetical protein [Anaerolineaceae bacterium]
MLSLVDRVYIVQDRDEDKVNKNGETYNPGANHADRLAKYVNEGRTREAKIILPPEGYKDANDVAQAGLLKEWLSEFKVEPSLNTAQAGLRGSVPTLPY